MGEINDKLCNLLSKPEYFADFWNGAVWTVGDRLNPKLLSRDDKEYYKFFRKSSGVRRDIFMKLRGKFAAKLGILLMCELEGMPAEYREQFWDYPLRLYSLRDLDEMRFETGLRELVAIFKRSKDRIAMKEYYEAHKERFKLLDTIVVDALGALIGMSKLRLFKQEGRGLDLCKAFEDEREEGRQEERVRVNTLFQYMIRDDRIDDLKRAVTDMLYQEGLLREYGLL